MNNKIKKMFDVFILYFYYNNFKIKFIIYFSIFKFKKKKNF